MVKVLTIQIYDKGLNAAVREVVTTCLSNQSKDNRCVSATGAHGLVYAQKNKQFGNILNRFFFNLPDGMPGVWIGRLKGAHEIDRCYGPDFFREIMIATRDMPVRHFFCGGKEGVADELRDACAIKFGNHNVVGTFCPPFREMNDNECYELAADIDGKGTDILWIGISTPRQEIFAARMAECLNVHFIVTVGAAFDFHIGKLRQAPRIVQRMGLEWLFRLCMEPKRLYKRYLEIVPLFIYYNLVELIRKSNSQEEL